MVNAESMNNCRRVTATGIVDDLAAPMMKPSSR
jgi:hypothetical protein